MEGGIGTRLLGVGDYYFQLVFLLVLLAKGGVFVCALSAYVLSYTQSVAGGEGGGGYMDKRTAQELVQLAG